MGRAAGSKLTDKQAAFVREYLVDSNATQAAIRAGYPPRSAGQQGERLLKKDEIRAAVDALMAKLAEKTETDAEWVLRRLKEEADDYSEFATHSGRIRALELVGKINGAFERDNKQKASPLDSLLAALTGNVMAPKRGNDA